MEEEKSLMIDIREMALKCTSKGEDYKVLTTTDGIYLPPVQQINWGFVRDILCGDKLVSFCFKFEVHSLKSGQDHWGATHRGSPYPRNIGIRSKTLRYTQLFARIWVREVSLTKVDLKHWWVCSTYAFW